MGVTMNALVVWQVQSSSRPHQTLDKSLQRRAFERFQRNARIAPCHRSLILAWPLAFWPGPYLFLPLVSRSIGEPLPSDALQGEVGALHIVYAEPDTIAIPEVELGEIAVQMLL